MRKALSALFLLALMAGAAAPARAQLGARSLEIEPFVGVMTFDEDVRLQDEVAFGGRIGFNFTDTWALEGTFNFIPNAKLDIPGLDEDDLDLPETSVYLAHANLVYNFPLNQSRLVPFLTAGGGIANFNVNNNDQIAEDSETDGEVNAGGGLKLFLSETIALRGDARHHWIFKEIPNEDPDQPGDEADHESTSNWEFTGGLSFNF
ncbi:MAG TPA: outer membrane beta-barrel domain-containing protein [Gemmatimonadota bacterium]|jgi:OOP family OmpA-OmpF porin